MATEVKIKRKLSALSADREGPVNFFVHKEDCKDEMSSDDDTTDSDESIFSGQEEESDTSEESEDSEDLSSHEDTTNETDDDDPSSSSKTNKKNSRTEGKANNNINIIKKSVITDGHSSTSVTDNTNHNDDEYDSSDEEDIRNTVGNIPLKWYEEFRHIGYDLDARKLIKPKKDDELDNFLNKMDDPDYLRTVTNKYTGQKVVLSEADVDLIKRIQKNKHFNPNEDLYKPWVDFFSSEERIHPVTNQPAHKRSFIPSKWEKVRVGQMVNAIRLGWWKPKPRNQGPEEESYYQLWKDEEEQEINKRYRHHIPAPKLPLPGHAESYNPPPEYLFTPEEKEMWEKQKPEKRQLNFIPQKYSSLRLVPGYRNFIRERFERCLDLYLCPRQRKMRVRDLDPQDLLPKLPKPKDLQPFPSVQAVIYKGHTDMVRCISVHPQGQWLVSGSDDHMVKLWEVSTGRCMKTLRVEGTVKSIAWNPNTSLCLFALVVDLSVIIINPGLLDKLIVSATDNIINSYVDVPADEDSPKKKPVPVKWQMYDGEDYQAGFRIQIIHPKEVRQVTWHAKGDYFAIVMPHADRFSVLIHQLSKRRTQNPFSKKKGLVQCILFHPIKPVLLVATQRYVRMYNLLRQELIKKLMANCRWVSSLAVHSGGDNVIIGSYDSKLNWFDMDLSAQPYQTLRHHKKAIRQVCFHKRYPLFASASDDCSVIVCHGMVYSDLLMNPLIVPVKILRGHAQARDLGVLDCQFHPYQPWIFSSGSDATIRLYT